MRSNFEGTNGILKGNILCTLHGTLNFLHGEEEGICLYMANHLISEILKSMQIMGSLMAV